MEQIQGTRKSIFSTKDDDIISSMPDIVITNILNRLPIQDAVRTSILTRNWRHMWTNVTQLVLDDDFILYLQNRHKKQNDNVGVVDWYDERNLSRSFSHIIGPITEFDLTIPYRKVLNVKILCDRLLFLSRKGIMKFTLTNSNGPNGESVELPTSIFSCLNLTHFKLYNCHFPPTPPSFCGFKNLLSLDVYQVTFTGEFCEIIKMSPLLEILKVGDEDPIPKLNLFELLKLKNLKVISLPVFAIDIMGVTNSLIVNGGPYFPNLEELFLSFARFEDEVEDVISGKLVCDSFSRVKSLISTFVDFDCNDVLPLVYDIIWGFPNLQNLSIQGLGDYESPSIELVFDTFEGSGNEWLFIKNLLACTPLLKKMTIRPDQYRHFDNHKFAKKLLSFERASSIAKVDLEVKVK